ncbi:META domain-containing protein [Campylobacter sp. US33a]|uniref:META domain-containing protein n=1 Tax=Campylobacter sp. CCS1377 TaxID=3158229 RepID=A0AAU7E6T5_9BACT|nr:META domain-containing protein [Campylobacter sp. US33a]MCW1360213.1 META domain-containing protein [Campylobacter jejuni]TEY00953.1 META domain-containing protein [Campylobacter sp. US33a]
MKKISILALGLLMSACVKNASLSIIEIENKTLSFVSIETNGKLYTPKEGGEIPSITFERDRFFGFAGCNRFFGGLGNLGDEGIEFKGAAATKMMCEPESMKFEDKILTSLTGIFKISKNGDNGYTLTKDDIVIRLK